MEEVQPASIGKYPILSVIGRGGMGIVYRALDPMMGRQVAIKTVTAGFSQDQAMLRRFYEEAEKMGMLRHPNVITVYDLGEQNGFPYIVMELVEGDPLDQLIRNGPPLSMLSKLGIIEQVCNALSYAHQNKVVHRDVKPANVIVRPDGVAKLLDFGIARQEKAEIERGVTVTGGVIGTVPYMAPERLKGAAFDGRSDIFSTGVLLFQVLTGTLPFTGTEYALVNQLLNEPHPPLSRFLDEYPAALDDILDRSLAKHPADRYSSADEMAADIYSILEVLKDKASLEMMAQAEQLSTRQDYLGAQNVLFQLIRMDSKNIQARAMLKKVGQHLSQQVRQSKAEDLRIGAADALRERNFDQAIRMLEEANGFLPDNTAILTLLNEARSKKQNNEHILSYLQRADAAKRNGDFTGAQSIMQKAIELDTNNSRLRAAYQSLVRQAEAAAHQAEVTSLLEAGREAVQRRDFDGALDLAQRAETLAGGSLDAQELARTAREGLFEIQRRLLLEDLEERIVHAVTEEETLSIAQTIRESLENTPSDAALLRYQIQVERTLHDFKVQRQVDLVLSQTRSMMESSPSSALEIVRQALLEAPGDHRLIALEARVQEHIGQMSTEEARAEVIQQANKALRGNDLAAAVAILERCAPPILTADITNLLLFAREELRKDEQQQLLTRCFADAQSLLRQEKYSECISLLEPVVTSSQDSRLRTYLEEAQRALALRTAQQAAALELVKPFADAGCHEQVLAITESLPASTQSSPEIEMLRDASTKAWQEEWIELQSLGRAYAALDAQAWKLKTKAFDTPYASPILNRMQEAAAGRRMNAVNTILTAQVELIRNAKENPATATPIPDLEETRALLPLASDRVKEEWTTATNEWSNSSRSGKRTSRFRKRN